MRILPISLVALVVVPALAAAANAPTAASLRGAREQVLSSLKRLDGDRDGRDAARLGADIRDLRKSVDALKASFSSSPDASKLVDCVRALEAGTWSLEQQSKDASTSASGFSDALDTVWLAGAACGVGVSDAVVASPADVDWALRKAGALLAEQRSSRRLQGICSGSFTVDKMSGLISSGAIDAKQMALLNTAVGYKTMHYYQNEFYAAGDADACDRIKPIEKLFVQESEAAVGCGSFRCRQWYYEKALDHAVLTRSPRLESVCESYIANEHPDFTAAEARRACVVISGNIGDPKALCSKLIPDFMSPDKLDACVGEFGRFKVYSDERACRAIESWPGPFLQQCLDHATFLQAFRAKDPQRCGDSELCWLYMGRWPERYAATYQNGIRQNYCTTLRRLAASDTEDGLALLDKSGRYLDLAATTGASPSARAQRNSIARLRAEFAGEQTAQRSAPASELYAAKN